MEVSALEVCDRAMDTIQKHYKLPIWLTNVTERTGNMAAAMAVVTASSNKETGSLIREYTEDPYLCELGLTRVLPGDPDYMYLEQRLLTTARVHLVSDSRIFRLPRPPINDSTEIIYAERVRAYWGGETAAVLLDSSSSPNLRFIRNINHQCIEFFGDIGYAGSRPEGSPERSRRFGVAMQRARQAQHLLQEGMDQGLISHATGSIMTAILVESTEAVARHDPDNRRALDGGQKGNLVLRGLGWLARTGVETSAAIVSTGVDVMTELAKEALDLAGELVVGLPNFRKY
jgi:hypothetical protein